MDVALWARETSRARAAADGWNVAASREQFFETSDVVSLHLRLVPETRGIVTADDLARMKGDAVLVNTSRAGLVQPGVLHSALESGRPGMAAIDVFDIEPFTQSAHPLVAHANVIATPHLGYVTIEEWELQFADVFDQINAFAAGAPVNVVNPGALAGDKQRG